MSARSLRGMLLSSQANSLSWASITEVTGSLTTGTYTDADGVTWKYYRWIAAGAVTLTPGVVDSLVVGGAGGSGANGSGVGGRVVPGMRVFPGGTHAVAVGAGGAAVNYSFGSPSSVGSILFAGGVRGLNGNGAGGTTDIVASPGVFSSITGSSVEYGAMLASGTPPANTGAASEPLNVAGAAGVVIIRVPVSFARA